MVFFFSSRRRHTILVSDWSSDVCSSDLGLLPVGTRFLRNRFDQVGAGHAWVSQSIIEWDRLSRGRDRRKRAFLSRSLGGIKENGGPRAHFQSTGRRSCLPSRSRYRT